MQVMLSRAVFQLTIPAVIVWLRAHGLTVRYPMNMVNIGCVERAATPYILQRALDSICCWLFASTEVA